MPSLDSTIAQLFRPGVGPRPDDGIVVAFSGGPDSTALLLGIVRLRASPPRSAPELAGLRLIAAHLDHALDGGSAERAAGAAALARRIGVPLVTERRPVAERRRPGESLETAARRERYAFLEEVRLAEAADWIATAHHRDDQAETVVLRLLYGTGLDGLAGIRPVRGRLLRPLLSLGHQELIETVRAAGIEPLNDPTNRDPCTARNRVRHALLPTLCRALRPIDSGTAVEPGAERVDPPRRQADPRPPLRERLADLAEAAAGARQRLDELFGKLLDPRPPESGGRGVVLDPAAFSALPEGLRPHALAFLHRRADAPYPASAPARTELVRQLERAGAQSPEGLRGGGANRPHVACDVGGGWRWRVREGRLELLPPGAGSCRTDASLPAGAVSYTLNAPGEVEVPELDLRVRIVREPVAGWMFRGSRRRAALDLPLGPAGEATGGDGRGLEVRTRRPGDRIRPLGAPGERKLKDVLIDRRVPRDRRDRLALLSLGGQIVWVPGVTVDDRFRVAPDAEVAWVAEVVPCQTSPTCPTSRTSKRSTRPTRSNARSSTSVGG